MSEEVLDLHLATVRRLSKPGGPLAIGATTETIKNRLWFTPPPLIAARSERRRLHARLIARAREEAGEVASGRVAYVLAGPPGAGKSTVIEELLAEARSDYLVVDPDRFKVWLLEEAVADGSFESVIKPPEIAALEEDGEKFFPLEFAALVHEESSRLAHLLSAEAVHSGLNLVVDGVLANAAKAKELVAQLERGRYDVRVIDVEVPYALCEQRVQTRWRQAYRDALADPSTAVGGRWVPSEYARSVFGSSAQSKCVASALAAAHSSPAVSEYRRYVTHEDGATPALVEHLRSAGPGGPLIALS